MANESDYSKGVTPKSRDQSQTLSVWEARQKLEKTRHQDAPFEKKARQALKLGEQYLGADNAHLTRINQENNHWEATVSTDPQGEQFPEGLELDLQSTYCRRTIAADDPITLYDAPAQGWDDDPALEACGVHSYHGHTLYTNGDPYGTLCFVSDDPRDKPFENDETLFADLITRLLERELERQEFQVEMTRRSNLINVLNRVLRHNLRNDLSIIRGQARQMADKLEGSPAAATALDKIDGLIELGEKAREIETIVDQDKTRVQTNLGRLIRDVIEDVSTEFPAASITLNADTGITARVLPSFKRAVRELVENGVKHGGETPSVSVSVKGSSETVEVRIADTGSGLPADEREVLRTGVETPLVHGSGLGLWIVHWIIASHGGSVDASVSEAGTTMSVSIPLALPPAENQDLADLTQARNQYQAAFEESFDAQLLLDDQARIIQANPGTKAIFGLNQQDLRGRSLAEFFPEEFEFDDLWSALLDHRSDDGIVTVLAVDGQPREVEYTATTNVVPGQHLLVARNVTERSQRKAELERYEAVVDSIDDAVWTYDETMRVTFTNQTEIEKVSISTERLVGMSLSGFEQFFADPETFDTWAALVKDVLAGDLNNGTLDAAFEFEGECVMLNLRVVPLPDSDDPTGVAVIASDISVRKPERTCLS